MSSVPELFSSSPQTTSRNTPDIAIDDAVLEALDNDAVVSVSISGGKDGHAMTIKIMEFLAKHGYKNEVVAIHADLGMIEWNDSLTVCQEIAKHYDIPLQVVNRPQGDMIEQWEQRWNNNLESFRSLNVTRIITPWSNSLWRFCTGGQKTDQIKKHFNNNYRLDRVCNTKPILNVVGIRHEESQIRANCPTSKINEGIKPGPSSPSLDWFPLIHFTTKDVFTTIAESGMRHHMAYDIGNTRVSCSFCVLGCKNDLKNASQLDEHQQAYRRLVDLEQASGFSFQASRWLMQINPSALRPDQKELIFQTISKATKLKEIHTTLPKHLEYRKRKAPWEIPSIEDCHIISDFRKQIYDIYSLEHILVGPGEIRDRVTELYEKSMLKKSKGTGKQNTIPPKRQEQQQTTLF